MVSLLVENFNSKIKLATLMGWQNTNFHERTRLTMNTVRPNRRNPQWRLL